MYINQVWPEWKEDCVLGEGSFGKVYRAKRDEYGRTFYSAIKVLKVPKSRDEIKEARKQGMSDEDVYYYFRSLVDNLLNEITLMDNLKGANNVVGIEDYKIIENESEIGWEIFIRMELLSPFDSFASNPEFSQADVLKLGVDICSALEVCEQNSIIHRDIKPDNIFVSRFGEYKLGDFGIARKLEATQANMSRKGTLNYMAPEVYKSEAYGSNVDIYSLGLVLYTLLNNNRTAFLPNYPQPITYKDNEDALARRLSGEALPPPCNASASLASVIQKACAYNPNDRYATAAEFKNALINEWNAICQSGVNYAVNTNGTQGEYYQNNLNNTTGDMSSLGVPVAGGYMNETTVINGGQTYGVSSDRVDIPTGYSDVRPVKACWIISVLMALGLIVAGVISISSIPMPFCVPMIGMSLIIVLCGRNKYALGACLLTLPLMYVVPNVYTLIDSIKGLAPIPFVPIIILISGLLMIFGGITIMLQREVRFGASLGFYSAVILWLLIGYFMLNDRTGFLRSYLEYGNTMDIFYAASSFTVFLWSYGYNSGEKIKGLKNIITFAITSVIGLAILALWIKIICFNNNTF